MVILNSNIEYLHGYMFFKKSVTFCNFCNRVTDLVTFGYRFLFFITLISLIISMRLRKLRKLQVLDTSPPYMFFSLVLTGAIFRERR